MHTLFMVSIDVILTSCKSVQQTGRVDWDSLQAENCIYHFKYIPVISSIHNKKKNNFKSWWKYEKKATTWIYRANVVAYNKVNNQTYNNSNKCTILQIYFSCYNHYWNNITFKYCFKLLKHSSIYTLAFYCLANAERRTRTHTHTYSCHLTKITACPRPVGGCRTTCREPMHSQGEHTNSPQKELSHFIHNII